MGDVLIPFSPPLSEAVLLRRYKRFLADVRWPDGREETVHCANTGAMYGCKRPGSRVWLSPASNPARKTRWTLEIVEDELGARVGVHTGRANALFAAILDGGLAFDSAARGGWRSEVKVDSHRIDYLLGENHYVEIKSVTASADGQTAFFPDAVSARATRHVGCLAELVQQGARATLCFLVQRDDVNAVTVADHIDPAYAAALDKAQQGGVRVVALQIVPSATGYYWSQALPWS